MRHKDYIVKFEELKKDSWSGLWSKRLLSELAFALEYSESVNGKYDTLLEERIEELYTYVQKNGAITKEIALSLEDELAEMQDGIKAFQVFVVAHAHIDMNWMWGFQETASVTVDTFETMLQLMEEYPQFTFSQSQASVYKIVEEYAPYLLEKIRKRVKEGRWEITASTWVENDKNMSGSEAMARHILYTKNYLSRLMDVPADSIAIDFEPDTFGHSENMPEILNKGGIKYYYHGRGFGEEHVYRWQSPSGAEVIVYRDPLSYGATVEYDALTCMPALCGKYGIHTGLKLYGVGDHGGGPTRRDISRWLEMQTWPLMPSIHFGTMREFFAEIEKEKDKLPVVKHELNYIFTGCYTTQTRIKRANKIGEDRLYEAEGLDMMALIAVPEHKTASEFEPAWEKVLFNQFHDILPGSGKVETREYALGEFQKVMASAQINMNHAMRDICQNIDTKALSDDETVEDCTFGAGVGFGPEDKESFMPSRVSRGSGKRRIITVFNPTPHRRKEIVKFQIWDWDGNPSAVYATDSAGNETGCEIVDKGTHYWGHNYHTVLLNADVESMGYATYVLDERSRVDFRLPLYSLIPVEMFPHNDEITDMPLVLENENVKAVFCPTTMKLYSFVDKVSGEEKISEPSCYFRYILENTKQEMTSWRVGTYMQVTDLNEKCSVKLLEYQKGTLSQQIKYHMTLGETSSINVKISLDEGSTALKFDVHVDWHELGSVEKGTPQLNFAVPVGYTSESYLCDIPFGIIERQPLAQDVPCTGFMGAVPQEMDQSGIVLMSDCKYGFRGYENMLSLTLIRSSFDPDPTPEQGDHYIKIGVGISVMESSALAGIFERFVHPLYVCSNNAHEGKLPCDQSFFGLDGDVRATAWKEAENGEGMIIRLHSLSSETKEVVLRAYKDISEACFTNVLEQAADGEIMIKGRELHLYMPAKAVATIRIKL